VLKGETGVLGDVRDLGEFSYFCSSLLDLGAASNGPTIKKAQARVP
jgi:hypothetical protein